MDQLSKDAKAARAAGMTYGKYKGLQYEQQQARIAAERRAREEERARKRTERETAETVESKPTGKLMDCLWCGGEFLSTYGRKTCCEECRVARRQFMIQENHNKKHGKEKA